MTQIVLTVPNGEVSFLSTLAEKMGWSFQTSENLVEKFSSLPVRQMSVFQMKRFRQK